ncbi:MAG TPA: hypothetical protein DCS93_13775 [Microscillaceae bacterium]|nr:hypothetical protein [Microscillaceae bacterium]
MGRVNKVDVKVAMMATKVNAQRGIKGCWCSPGAKPLFGGESNNTKRYGERILFAIKDRAIIS